MNKNDNPYCGLRRDRSNCNCSNLMGELNDVMDAETVTSSGYGRNCKDMEKCSFDTWNVAMAYVPMQPWRDLYELPEGLRRGTIFSDLDLPFIGGGPK